MENPRLLNLGRTGEGEGASRIRTRRRPVFQDNRLDVRDDRLIVVGHLDSSGPGTYLYAARAVAPGVFVTPAVRAECMYDIGTYSVWGAGTFEVLPIETMKVAEARGNKTASRPSPGIFK